VQRYINLQDYENKIKICQIPTVPTAYNGARKRRTMAAFFLGNTISVKRRKQTAVFYSHAPLRNIKFVNPPIFKYLCARKQWMRKH
jgi:hypothetical protein